MEIKVGDIVICKAWTYTSLTHGREYKVVSTKIKGFIWVHNDFGDKSKFKVDNFSIKEQSKIA